MAGAFAIVPSRVLGGKGNTPPSEKLNIAGVGIGGMGRRNVHALSSENIVALCDVDFKNAGSVFKKYPKARRYKDFRRMLDKEKSIDGVVVATPDHTHAVVSMEAIRRGKHVYCQKPLAHSVYECRRLSEAARKYGVATQMGNQGRSGESIRIVKEWIKDGAIGEVREVHCWTPFPHGVWAQGIERPQETVEVPPTLDWDLWIGPAPYRPYHPMYHPFKWRGWWDFGTGAIGDQACHTIDVPFWALELGSACSVQASCSPVNSETYPVASIVRYEFPARGDKPAVKLTWYDGGLMPQRPDELEAGRRMGNQYGGALFIGSSGKLMCGTFGEGPRLIPESRMKEYELPPETIPRIECSHEEDWLRACKGGRPACSNFDYAGPLTEVAMLGNLAIRCGGEVIVGGRKVRTVKKLEWDGRKMEFTNDDEANKYVRDEYRKGWSL